MRSSSYPPLTMSLVVGALLLASAPLATAQGVPGADKNKCLAGKTQCVSKKITGLLKCREKCQKNPSKCGAEQILCEKTVMSDFDGGNDPTKGCFAKLEAKEKPSKPVSICTTTEDTAAMEAEVDGAAAELLARLEGAPVPTCGDGVVNVAGEHCDGADMGGATCLTLTGRPWPGVLRCTEYCHFDLLACNGTPS